MTSTLVFCSGCFSSGGSGEDQGRAEDRDDCSSASRQLSGERTRRAWREQCRGQRRTPQRRRGASRHWGRPPYRSPEKRPRQEAAAGESVPACTRGLELSFSQLNVIEHTAVLTLTGPELRVGTGPGRHQEDAERRAARRERQGRSRQVQDAAPDPPGKHQATNRWIRVYVRSADPWPQNPSPLPPAHFPAPLSKLQPWCLGSWLISTAFIQSPCFFFW